MDIPDIGRKIVINGLIATDNLVNVKITESSYINDISGDAYQSSTDLKGAEVRFYQNNTFIDSLYYIYDDYFYAWNVFYIGNYWSKSVFPLPGQEYKVIVKVPGLPDASASTIIPNFVRIELIDTSRILLAPGTYYASNVGLQCKIEFSDPANENNYYLLKAYLINYLSSYHDSSTIGFICKDPIVEEKLSSDELKGIAFSDKIINGQRHDLDIIVKGETIGKPYIDYTQSSWQEDHRTTVFFQLYSITEEYFKFIQSLNLYYKNYDNPLAEPVFMYSNVRGGYGMFSGAAVSTDSISFQY
jgi:hypothetical protein